MTGNTETLIVAAIEGAEEIVDPIDGLVERVAEDPGAPFKPDVVERLRALKNEDLAAFEALRAQLKKAGCRMTALDDALAEKSGDAGGRDPSQADILMKLAAEASFFHAPDSTGYADLEINGHRETWPIRSKGFRRWLLRKFYDATDRAPNSEALHSALNVIEAKAHFDAPQMDVSIRVAGHDGKLYFDLADDAWRAIEIDADGWRVVEGPPVRFRRAAGMLPISVPVTGGSIETLRGFLNVGSDSDFVLIVAWALAVLRDKGPYPVIVLTGEQGSAKSTALAILRALLDPNSAPLRALSRTDRDLFITASNGHVLAFDNVSGLPPWISDTLCRLATGGGFAVRQLYTDLDEVLFDATRPVMLNGIEDIVSRPDLADRAIFLTLQPIPEEHRRPEKQLWAEFDKERPKILGALLDAVSYGLRHLPDTSLEKLPRMADFALWATACEGAVWVGGTFKAAYMDNLDEAVDTVIEGDLVASAIRSLMASRTEWTGTATQLLGIVSEQVAESARKAKSWPSTPRTLSGRVRRAATFLRKVGIDISFGKEKNKARTRIIRIFCLPENTPTEPSAPSASSAVTPQPKKGNGCATDDMQMVVMGADGQADDKGAGLAATVLANSLNSKVKNGADGADANISPQSVPDHDVNCPKPAENQVSGLIAIELPFQVEMPSTPEALPQPKPGDAEASATTKIGSAPKKNGPECEEPSYGQNLGPDHSDTDGEVAS